jgi:chromosomal replication initiator protein
MRKDYQEVWENCLRIIKDNINYQSFKTWFSPIKPVKLDESVLTIQVPSQFFYEWLEEHYINLLKKTIKQELGQNGRLEYSIIMESYNDARPPYTIQVPTSNKGCWQIRLFLCPSISTKAQQKKFPIPL